jgi:hypothetical protein
MRRGQATIELLILLGLAVALIAFIAFAAPPLAEIALKFGAPEYFSLMVFGLIASAVLARGSLLKALGMIVVGLLFGIIGTDVNSGMSRFTFGLPGLSDGIGFVVIAMAFFGLGEIIKNLETAEPPPTPLQEKLESMAKQIGLMGIGGGIGRGGGGIGAPGAGGWLSILCGLIMMLMFVLPLFLDLGASSFIAFNRPPPVARAIRPPVGRVPPV